MPSKSKSKKYDPIAIAESLDLEPMELSEDYDVEPIGEPESIEAPQVEESSIEAPQVEESSVEAPQVEESSVEAPVKEEAPKEVIESVRGMCKAKLASTGEKLGYVSLSDPRWKTREIVHANAN